MTFPARRCPSILSTTLASLLAVAVGSLVVAFPADSRAETPVPPPSTAPSAIPPAPPAAVVVNAEVMVLHATLVDTSGFIDPAIGSLPQLRKPPLSAYNTYKLLDKRALPIQMGRSATYTLANGRVLQLTFIEPTPQNGFHVKAAINQPGGNAYLKQLELTAKPNEPFFLAGQQYKGGVLVLAITLRR
jgi:hypothetical protein